jgi:hypothetical protein
VSASLESYLVKLYLDRDTRRAILDDPRGAAVEPAARSVALERVRRAPRGLGGRLRAMLRRWGGTS